MMSAADVREALDAVADPAAAVQLQRYFKTGQGEYGEGDRFLGLRVPAVRRIAARFGDLPLDEFDALIESPVHEHRLAALVILVGQFDRASRPKTRDEARRKELADRYLAAVRRGRVDNWDLVDLSAEFVTGEYLQGGPIDLLHELAASPSVWERRVAMLSTFAFTKHGEAGPTLEIAEVLLEDPHDLIRKAVGWMLREVGKRVDRDRLTGFLDHHAARMPRTALAYATEHLDAAERAHYRSL
jgi:3-methyladenine DNA glycosylase AlkD